MDQKPEMPDKKLSLDKSATIRQKKWRSTTLTPCKTKSESDKTVAVTNYFSGNLDGLEEKVRGMMVKSQNFLASGNLKAYACMCNVCGKEHI